MKGIIFNVVEDAMSAEHGDWTWDRLLRTAELPGGYTSLGDYPDGELHQLIAVGSRELGVSEPELTRWFGRAALLNLAVRYPGFFTPHQRTRDFLLTLNDVIHAEVRKVHRNANPPTFDFEPVGDRSLTVTYHSTRGLCLLAEGMIDGAASHFGERAQITQDRCTTDGASSCRLVCEFVDEAADDAC